MKHEMITRREFLQTSGLVAGGIIGSSVLHGRPHLLAQSDTPAPRSVVAVVADPAAVDANWKIEPVRAERMVNEAVMLLTGQTTPEAAWVNIFPSVKPTDVVGIKVNTLNPSCPSHVEVALAVAAGLQKAGFKENNIIIWDRAEGSFIEGLTASGYKINRTASGVRCLGTNSPSIGYDLRNLVSIPCVQKTMPVSKLISQICQYIVNLPVMKHHVITGLTGCLKNYYGAIPLGDRVSLFDINLMHQNNASPQIAELYANALIREKTRLHICDALMSILNGGPHGSPQWKSCQILAATDPVALDFQILQILNKKRIEMNARPLDQKAAHILAAAERGLGVCKSHLIEVRTKICGQS